MLEGIGEDRGLALDVVVLFVIELGEEDEEVKLALFDDGLVELAGIGGFLSLAQDNTDDG